MAIAAGNHGPLACLQCSGGIEVVKLVRKWEGAKASSQSEKSCQLPSGAFCLIVTLIVYNRK